MASLYAGVQLRLTEQRRYDGVLNPRGTILTVGTDIDETEGHRLVESGGAVVHDGSTSTVLGGGVNNQGGGGVSQAYVDAQLGGKIATTAATALIDLKADQTQVDAIAARLTTEEGISEVTSVARVTTPSDGLLVTYDDTSTQHLPDPAAAPGEATKIEAEAGTEPGVRSFSPLRIAQSIVALGRNALLSTTEWTKGLAALTGVQTLQDLANYLDAVLRREPISTTGTSHVAEDYDTFMFTNPAHSVRIPAGVKGVIVINGTSTPFYEFDATNSTWLTTDAGNTIGAGQALSVAFSELRFTYDAGSTNFIVTAAEVASPINLDSVVVDVPYSAAPALDADAADYFKVSQLTGAITLAAIANAKEGNSYVIRLLDLNGQAVLLAAELLPQTGLQVGAIDSTAGKDLTIYLFCTEAGGTPKFEVSLTQDT